MVAHEVVHSIQREDQKGIVLKLDYQKTYDRVNLEFVLEILNTRGFSPKWVGWILQLIKEGSVGVTLNGNDSNFFKTGKGLRQGDPISPLMFNLVGDVLTRMLKKAADRGLISGLLTDLREQGVISLQYANDTILFSDTNELHLKNLKGVLMWFEQISGMRINFHKSEMIPINLERNEERTCSL